MALSKVFFTFWLRKQTGFWGYQSWGRLATSWATLLYGRRAMASRLSPAAHLQLLEDKYLTLATAGRHWTPAYLFSSTTTSSKEVLAVQTFRENLLLEYI